MNKILKIIFPELEIADAIKQDGFSRKRNNGELNVRAGAEALFTQNDMRMQSASSVSKAQNSVSAMSNSQYTNYTPSPLAKKSDDLFNDIENELYQVWIGSRENISAAVLAFKRPFVMGTTGFVPANNILIVGGESRGKKSLVLDMAKTMKAHKIIKHEQVSMLDMSKYQTKDDESIFMTDIYQALYTPSDILIVENITFAAFNYIQVISELMKNGKLDLKNRYLNNYSSLVQSTGTLNTNSVSSISANGKYFVFLTNSTKEKFAEKMGNDFMHAIGDIVNLDDLTDEELQRLVASFCYELTMRILKNLDVTVDMDESARAEVKQLYSIDKGIRGFLDSLTENIYRPIAEYKLKGNINAGERFILSSKEHVYKIKNDEKEYELSEKKSIYDALAINEVKNELNDVIGLENVKKYVLSLETNLNVQNMRKAQGLKTADISMHMIFTGNPGTGKTTIARIVAKYLKALGILSSGQLIEVTRSNLVGMYVGQTAQLTGDAIKSALGGVLFIDEAYSLCRNKQDIFGLEAVDALVKGIEDNRDKLVVILAGYTQEMTDFIENNPGLKSRFPNVIEFPDYSSEEMYQIALIAAKEKGYRISETCHDKLIASFDKSQIKGKNDAGNGRLVRNMVESAILKQAKRITESKDSNLEELTADDFGLQEREEFNLEEQLSGIIGLEKVKDFVRSQYAMVLAREKRRKADLNVDTTESLNMIFTGNPGTGKTTMARVIANMFHEMGVLKSGQLVETDKGGLIGQYQGETIKKTEKVFKSALGGVLFIDEAYAITNDHSPYGQECIDVLVKLIEDFRGELLVILAGYTKEMSDFLKSNSGLESRFPLKIEFPDYSDKELYAIGMKMINDKGFRITEEAKAGFKEHINLLKTHADSSSGNGRMVRNYVEATIRKQSERIAATEVTEELDTIVPADLDDKSNRNEEYDLEKDLSGIVGLDNVKEYIRALKARLVIQKKRKEMGLKTDESQTMHMIFKGNPGTGKTMMARTVANVLASLGVISENKLIETDRSGLVAGYVGQTAIKTRQVIESALGGVLFVDEAYSLAQGGENDFGQEAIDTMVKMMDDKRDRLVIILAGYSDDMNRFLEKNAGLKSRFANIIEFPDYNLSQLMSISENMYENKGYILSDGAKQMLAAVFKDEMQKKDFGNGRYVLNVVERSINRQALRLNLNKHLNKSELVTISDTDIEEA